MLSLGLCESLHIITACYDRFNDKILYADSVLCKYGRKLLFYDFADFKEIL